MTGWPGDWQLSLHDLHVFLLQLRFKLSIFTTITVSPVMYDQTRHTASSPGLPLSIIISLSLGALYWHVGWVQCNYIITVCPIYKIIPRVTSLHLGAPSYSSRLGSEITGIIMDRVRGIVSLAQCEIFSLKCFKWFPQPGWKINDVCVWDGDYCLSEVMGVGWGQIRNLIQFSSELISAT